MVYERDFKSRLRWKRPDLCPDCAGDGEVDWRHTFAFGWEKRMCCRCAGTGARKPSIEKYYA